MKTAKQILKEEWGKVTSAPFDETTENHLGYVLKAMQIYADQRKPKSTKTAKELAEQIYYRRTQMNALDAKDEELIEYFAYCIDNYCDEKRKEIK